MAQEKKDGLKEVEDSKLKEVTGGQLYADSDRGNTEPEQAEDDDKPASHSS
jgi:hypothetical protein